MNLKGTSDSSFFAGYDTEENFTCTVAKINKNNLEKLQSMGLKKIKINDWFVSSCKRHDLTVFGPFTTMEAAFDYCHQNLDVKKFRFNP